MVAPAASRSRVSACLSASVIGGAGAGVSAEPPPETRTSTRSSAPAASASVANRARGRGARARRGPGCPASSEPHPARRREVAVLHRHHAVGDAVAQRLLGRGGHGARRLAGADHEHAAGRARGETPSASAWWTSGRDVAGARARRRRPRGPPRAGSPRELLQPAARLDEHVVRLGEAEADLGPAQLAGGRRRTSPGTVATPTSLMRCMAKAVSSAQS